MARNEDDTLNEKDNRYIQGLRSVARFGWLIYFFVILLVLQVVATVYFVRAIFYGREIIIWQSLTECLALLFIVILFREKLVAHRVIEKLIRKASQTSEVRED